MTETFLFDQIELEDSLPEAIQNWLAERFLLRGIPFCYIVPEGTMLPPDSIRFFRIDPVWLGALTDGALSLGRQTSADCVVDTEVHPILMRRASIAMPEHRMTLMHQNHQRIADAKALSPEMPLSGFLLRCALVRSWKGIEVQGNQGTKNCPIMRMEILDDDLLLCLFSGEVDRVVFLEPSEALHFGAKGGNITLRRITGEIGEYTGKKIPLPVEPSRRVRIKELANQLSGELGGEISSAELALQLFCTADYCEIERK